MRLRRLSPFAFVALVAGLAGALLLLALLEATILRPIPGVPGADRLVSLAEPGAVSYPALRDLDEFVRARAGLEGVAGFSQRWFAVAAGQGPEARRSGTVVAGDYFALLETRTRIGRLLTRADDRPGAPPVVVLSHSLWRELFAGRENALGETLRLNGTPFEVVGVADASFRGLTRERRAAFWVSASAWMANAPTSFGRLSLDRRSWGWLRAFGRLAPGASITGAREVLTAAGAEQSRLYPSESGNDYEAVRLAPATLSAAGLSSARVARSISLAIAAGVVLLLVLATASAAQIFFARAESRRQELATRLALGAGGGRLVLLLLVEPIATAALAVAAALALARGLLDLLARQSLPGGLRLGELGLAIDARVAVGGALLALAAGLAAGLLPARRLLREDLANAIGPARSVTGGFAGTRRIFSTSQVAVSLVLVTATALCVRALDRAASLDSGYRGDRLAFLQLDAGLARLSPAAAAARYSAALEAVSALGGVERAALISNPPLDPGEDVESFTVAGDVPAAGERRETEVSAVGPGALSLLGIDLVAGREISAADRAGSEPVVVVSQAFVRRFLPDRDPLGVVLTLDVPRRIVGVARDVRAHGPGEVQGPAIYGAWDQVATKSGGSAVIAFRSRTGAGDRLVEAVRAAAAAAPGVPVEPIGSFDDLVASALAAQRFGAALFGLFSGVALLLAAVGLFGLVAHAASMRARELGLRAALGAAPLRLVSHLTRDSLTPVAVGLGVGLTLATPLVFAARGLFAGLERLDFAAPLLAALVLAATAALATLLPASRAARIDPNRALRQE